MGLLSWFGSSSTPDYETILARLASDINDAKTNLSEIRLRERRWTLLVNAYGIAVWAVLFGLWWLNSLPRAVFGDNPGSPQSRLVAGSVVASGPLVLYLLNKFVHLIFTRQRNSSVERLMPERHLRKLLTEQRTHVEQIKKATNYDSTRKLIERYDDPLAAASSSTRTPPNSKQNPQAQQLGPGSATGSPLTPNQTPDTPSPAGRQGTPRAPGHLQGIGGTPSGDPQTPVRATEGYSPDQAAALRFQLQSAHADLPTPQKKWYDRVVDSILGDDPSQAVTSQYALVCGACFRHNGLVPSKYEWERMQWICPRCNHMNMPPISRQSEESQSTSREVAPPSAAAHLSRASPRQRRQPPTERGTPRSSRLGQEVFSASDASDEDDEPVAEDGAAEVKEGEPMDVDEIK